MSLKCLNLMYLWLFLSQNVHSQAIDLELENLGYCGTMPPESQSNLRMGRNRSKLKGKFFRNFMKNEPKTRIVGGEEVKVPYPW